MRKSRFKKISSYLVPLLAIFLVLCSQERSFLKTLGFSVKNDTVEADQDSLSTALKLQQSLRNVSKSVSPAVVNIRTEKTVKTRNPSGDFFNDPFFRRFFGDPGERQPQQRKQQSLGSGFIISTEGYIISNNHVVSGSDTITVYLDDNQSYTAKIIGADEKTDIALLKIEPKGKPLAIAPLGDSTDIQVGDFAIAIGNPFGLNWTFTFGVISATGRNTAVDPDAPFKNYIQTDVSINPGNSGGPLLNIKGQVIGINTAIFSQSGGSIGIGFAVPINIAKNVVQQLIQKGKVERGYIGAFVQDIDENLAKYHNLDQIQGVLLTDIESDSPAEKAGLKAGDLVLSANGARVDNASSLITVISNIPPGETITLEIMRNKKKMSIKVIVGIRTEEKTSQLKPGEDWLGMRFGALNSFRRNFNLPENIKNGVVITEVQEDSPAAQVGLRPGDLVDMINNVPIPDMKGLDSFIRQNKNKTQFLMRVRRAGRIYFVVLNAQ